MSSLPLQQPVPPPDLPVGLAPPQTLAAQVWHQTFSRLTARLGSIWVLVIATCAVLAPILANSMPWLVKIGGHWGSPALEYFTAADVVMLVAGIAGVTMLFLRRLRVGARILIVLWLVAVSVPLTQWKMLPTDWRSYELLGRFLTVLGGGVMLAAIVVLPIWMRLSALGYALLGAAAAALAVVLIVSPVNPPGVIIYDAYREAEAHGRLQYVLRSPVPYSPKDRFDDQMGLKWQAPSMNHWMGTDRESFDVLSRMIHAARIALFIGFIATGIALTIGVLIGGLMGYFSGTVDILGMRLIEIFDAIPTLFLLITFVAFFGRNIYIMMAIIGFTGWVGYARFIRAEFLKLRQQDFVHAAIAAGLPLRSVLFKHMLPNGIAPVLVSASFGIASAILAESTLSFLGLGLVEDPSWGEMLNQAFGEGGGTFIWWMALFPGVAIFLTVFSYNLVGESLRDALDPKLRKSSQ